MINNHAEVSHPFQELSRTNNDLQQTVRQKDKQLAKLHAQLAQAGKLAALGLQGAGIAHELNNPLTVISAEADEILDAIQGGNCDEKQIQASAKNIKSFSERMRVIVDHIRQYTRDDKNSNWTRININNVINDSLIIWKRQLINADIKVRLSLPQHLPDIWGQQNKLESVFQNLIGNARDAFEAVDDDRIKEIAIVSALDNNEILVKVDDNACGMSQEVLQKIYSPFFTTKTRENGTGIGLSMVHNIIKEHGGKILVNSIPGKGTAFTIKLPLERRSRADNNNQHDGKPQ